MERTIALKTQRLKKIIYQSSDFLEAYLDKEHIIDIKPINVLDIHEF